ncbi:eukaryotic translation initiation factor 5B-like isoform X2 [Chenopodium quinoa]|uniref:eukaryotic translation initiation factor 5B-like isoform X2 n=1 Tax=Chenopodium quinoa TaxID=63459 RepID=UPI000B793BD7|nr:eukaryotic translation initiation factor 5B-like isoform X2 [Chenopodium quinoa]
MAEPSTSQIQTTTTATAATSTVTPPSSWGTQEELLLACAVQRHGIDAWDSVSRELHNRTSFSHFTPLVCQQKYRDLKRRFASDVAGDIAADDAGLWLEELRRLRVAELRRDLQRYDLSIVSLQLKVKKLKEERESDVKEEIKEERENISDPKKIEERETEINEVKNEPEPVPVEPDGSEPDRMGEPVDGGEEDDSCNGSSNSKEERRSEKERRERVDSGELVESVAESKDDGGGGGGGGVKESSDLQSTASLWRSEKNDDDCNNGNDNDKIGDENKRGKKIGVFSGNSSGEENQSPAVKSSGEGKSRTLAEFLDVVRARKLGSFFERRLESQHIDLETIQRRLEEGQYSDCQTKFYRDLMLLINNAIVFFTKRSSEHKAALELRQLLNKQFQSQLSSPHDHKSRPSKPVQPAPLPKPTKPEANQADLKQPNLTVNGLVIACRKRSSIAGKSSRGVSEKREPAGPAPATPPDEKAPIGEMVKQQREKASSTSFNTVTKKRTRDQSFGSRSSSSKNNSNPNPNTPISSKTESSEAKADKKKPSPGNSSNKIKQVSGSASGKTLFLQSLKNSDKRKNGNGGSSSSVKSDRRKDEGPQNGSGSKLSKEKTGKEERESRGNRSSSRPPKRAAAIAAMGKRGRDGGSVDADSHSKKRQRK